MMRKNAILLLSAMLLLSACAQENNGEITETVMNGEAASFTEAEVTTAVETTVTATDTTTAETTITEPAPPALPAEPKEPLTVNDDGIAVLDLEALAENYSDELHFLSGSEVKYLSGDLILAAYKSDNGDYGLVVDISNGSVINRIPGTIYPFYRGQRLLCKLKNKDGYIYDIHDDGTYELTEYTDDDNVPVICGSHRIVSDDTGNIIDSESGEVIVPAYIDYDENGMPSIEGKHDIRYAVITAVDSDRFLYQGFGYEWSTGLSVYDFKTGGSVDIPHSSYPDYIANIGIVDGNIYWSDGGNLYRYDVNTCKNVIITGFEEIGNTAAAYVLPENGEYIGAEIYKYDESDHYYIHYSYVVIDRDSGEIIYTLPDTFSATRKGHVFSGESDLFFTDSFICVRDYNKIYMYPRDSITDLTAYSNETRQYMSGLISNTDFKSLSDIWMYAQVTDMNGDGIPEVIIECYPLLSDHETHYSYVFSRNEKTIFTVREKDSENPYSYYGGMVTSYRDKNDNNIFIVRISFGGVGTGEFGQSMVEFDGDELKLIDIYRQNWKSESGEIQYRYFDGEFTSETGNDEYDRFFSSVEETDLCKSFVSLRGNDALPLESDEAYMLIAGLLDDFYCS